MIKEQRSNLKAKNVNIFGLWDLNATVDRSGPLIHLMTEKIDLDR